VKQPNSIIFNKSFKCIIADDSQFARMNIGKIVSSIGGQVTGEAKNGIEAIELYFRIKPDILLLDITMPELDGIETLKIIMDKDNTAKIIVISSLGHKKMMLNAISLGAKHFITKPYNSEQVSLVIKSVLENGADQ